MVLSLAAVMVGAPGYAAAKAANRISIYAAPDGTGTACTADKPCSIQQAQLSTRTAAADMDSDIHVLLAGGTYYLAEPLTFTSADSGRNGFRIVWKPAGQQRPVLSGGIPLSGWAPATDAPNRWSVDVPDGISTRGLYANDVRVPRSRGTSPVTLTRTTPTSNFASGGYTAANSSLASWRNPDQIEFVYDDHQAWGQSRCLVGGIVGTAVTMSQPCWQNTQRRSSPIGQGNDNPSGGFPSLAANSQPSWIENAFELMKAGDWYYDKSLHKVYYWPKSGEDPASMSFVLAVKEHVVYSEASWADPLANVTFTGLEYAHTTWYQPSTNVGFSQIQASNTVTLPNGYNFQGLCQYVTNPPVLPPAGELPGQCPTENYTPPTATVQLSGTKNVQFLNSKFHHIGNAGLWLYHGANGDLVEGNEFTDISSNGLVLGAMDDPLPLDDDPDEIAINNSIRNNYLYNVAEEFSGGVGISVYYTRGTVVEHNQLMDMPYTGVSFGWGGHHIDINHLTADPSINQDNTIRNNVFINTMRDRSDGGPMYSQGHQSNNTWEHALQVTGNVAFSNPGSRYFFYHDEGSSYIVLDGNAEYGNGGGFNGGCTTPGPVRVTNNYRVGAINSNICSFNGPAANFTSQGNVQISSSPSPGVIPNSLLSNAGLQPAYQHLLYQQPPRIYIVSDPNSATGTLISGSGFGPDSQVAIGGYPAKLVQYVSPNYLIAHFAPGKTTGDLTVTNAAGAGTKPGLIGGNNVALGKPASQISTLTGYGDLSAGKGVDGNTSGDYTQQAMAHTNSAANAWWRVDLGQVYNLDKIQVWNRTGAQSEVDRDKDYWVLVSSTPFTDDKSAAAWAATPGVWSFRDSGTMGRPTIIDGPMTGRYIQVQLSGTNYLVVAELMAFITETAPPPPVITSPADAAAGNGAVTVTGTAERWSTITVRDGGTTVCTTEADLTGSWSCTPESGLAAGSHSLTATATNADKQTSEPSTPISYLVLNGAGFTTGGGWVTEPSLGTKSDFGFTVKYLKNGNIQGNSQYTYRKTLTANQVADSEGSYLPAGDYDWTIKSSVMTALAQSCTSTTPKVCTATFTGKSAITAVNQATEIAYSLGDGYQFQVDITDNGEPGSGNATTNPDTYAIRVWDAGGTYYQLGAPTAQRPLNGGNIQVRP
ncbi:right-handed parallel beta-helix repeat-containing protein [Streptosporangium sp. NPDC001681]|uniref:galactose-binding domain-containing protein n=1 Tax=Streptosporangium sp. NPDC001681 TaxID=3154395 RepID=UPI00332D9F77